MYDELTSLAKKTKANIKSEVHPWLWVVGPRDIYECLDLYNGKIYDPVDMQVRLSASTGKKTDDVFHYCVFNRTGKHKLLFCVYYQNSDIAGIHRMEINIVKPSEKIKTEEPVLIDTLWINNRKEIVYQDGESFIPVLKKSDLPKDFLGGNIPEYEYDKDKNIKNTIMQLYKQEDHLFYMDTRRGYSNVTTPWILREFLFSKETTKRNTKKQKLIDDIGLELGDPHIDADYIKNVIVPTYRLGMLMEIYVLEKIHDGCVMRCFVKQLGVDFPIMERRRIFVTKKDVIYARRNNLGEFVVTTKKTERQMEVSCTIPFDFNIIDGTPLMYIKNYLGSFPVNAIGNLFNAVLLSPVIEYALKEGMLDYVKMSLEWHNNSGYRVINNLCYCLGADHYSEKFKDFVGMTKKQYSTVMERYPLSDYWYTFNNRPFTPISYIKDIAGSIYGKKDTRFLDDRAFGCLLCIFDVISQTAKDCSISLGGMQQMVTDAKGIIQHLYQVHGMKMESIAEFFHVMGLSGLTLQFIGLYADYLYMYDGLRNESVRRRFSLVPDMHALVELHNELTCEYNNEKQEIDTINFLKNCKNASKYEYEDDDYMVICPDDPAQVIDEGNSLNHCVSSYISRVADGETNIMFIREKDSPDKPFFTVQVNDDGHVVQIHGLRNRNVDTEPGLDVFVRKWFSDKGLFSAGYNGIL